MRRARGRSAFAIVVGVRAHGLIRNSVLVLLVLVSVLTFSYVILSVLRHRGDLAVQLADFAQQVALPYRVARLQALPPDTELLMPIDGLRVRDVADTWGEARSEGRTHEGVDIFAPRGTPVFAVADGYVLRTGSNNLGGIYVFTVGAGGRRYYFAHLAAVADGLNRGDEVTTDTVLGFVGNTGNASATPPHLHLGVYERGGPINPYPLLVEGERYP